MSVTTNEVVITDDVRALAIFESGAVTGMEEIVWLAILDTMIFVEQNYYNSSSDTNGIVVYLDESSSRLQLMQTEGAIPVWKANLYRYSGWGNYSTGERYPYQGTFSFYRPESPFGAAEYCLVDESSDDIAFEDLIRDGVLSIEDLDEPRREIVSSLAAEITAYIGHSVKSRISSDL